MASRLEGDRESGRRQFTDQHPIHGKNLVEERPRPWEVPSGEGDLSERVVSDAMRLRS